MRSRDASLVTSLLLLAVFFVAFGTAAETWRGLVIAPEYRCSSYDKKRDYPYPQAIEREIVRRLGAVYGPYTGTCFASTRLSAAVVKSQKRHFKVSHLQNCVYEWDFLSPCQARGRLWG